MPYGGFKFLPEEKKQGINWETIDLSQNVGFFVEVDLEVPKEIWEYTKDFPLCPENIEITFDMLSPFQKTSLNEIYNRKYYKQRKLTATFLPKRKM